MNYFRLFSTGFVLAIIYLGISESFAQNAIIINTDKTSYGPGDLVTVTGTVSGAPNQLVAIQVKDPSGNLISIRTVQTDSKGNFELTFKVPSTATSGSFEINANTKINGQTVSTTQTFAQAVPEFGTLASVVFSISIITTIVVSGKLRLCT
ncbi:MAG: PEFG-CTERM sorting domain-containing protein [Thaumarchaeota archaeon]|nr:PEFG-CTERM sorting domain-containing protein [Nitrososphaerota archaeon]MDE1862001.1 PEFG-CTERM sorting domain-containing protein [Nitrososphaerota archaeon]